MKSLACYSIKGGVGKTAAASVLAYLAAQQGKRVLLWDLDPQGAATFCFRVKPKTRGGAKKLLHGKRNPASLVRGTDYEGLDLLRAHFAFRNMDRILAETRKPTRQLGRLIRPLAGEYDWLIFDCPPGITLSAEAVFFAVDALLVPTVPTTLSLRALEQLHWYLRRKGPSNLRVLPFLSMVDGRKSLHRQVCQQAAALPFGFLASHVPYASEVEQMAVRRTPLPAYARSSRATRAFAALWDEIQVALQTPAKRKK